MLKLILKDRNERDKNERMLKINPECKDYWRSDNIHTLQDGEKVFW